MLPAFAMLTQPPLRLPVRSYNVHPIAHSLERFSNRRMMMVIRRAVRQPPMLLLLLRLHGPSGGPWRRQQGLRLVHVAFYARAARLLHRCLTPPPSRLPPSAQLLVCTCVFTLVAAGGYCLFGSSTDANILNNLTPYGLATIIGPTAGTVLSFCVRVGYCTCLMVRRDGGAAQVPQLRAGRGARHAGVAARPPRRPPPPITHHPSPQATFAMLNWALRETATKLLFGKPMLPGPGFYALSYALLAGVYGVAILVPSGAWGMA